MQTKSLLCAAIITFVFSCKLQTKSESTAKDDPVAVRDEEQGKISSFASMLMEETVQGLSAARLSHFSGEARRLEGMLTLMLDIDIENANYYRRRDIKNTKDLLTDLGANFSREARRYDPEERQELLELVHTAGRRLLDSLDWERVDAPTPAPGTDSAGATSGGDPRPDPRDSCSGFWYSSWNDCLTVRNTNTMTHREAKEFCEGFGEELLSQLHLIGIPDLYDQAIDAGAPNFVLNGEYWLRSYRSINEYNTIILKRGAWETGSARQSARKLVMCKK